MTSSALPRRNTDPVPSRPPDEEISPRGTASDALRSLAPRPWEAIAVAAAVAIIYFTCTGAFDLLVGTFNDDGVYVALGKALQSGAGYHSIHLAGDPVHAKYPPGLPALLAVLWALTGSLDAVQGIGVTLSILVTAAASGVVWWYARTRLLLHPALAGVLAIGPFLLDASTQMFALIITEPYFVLGWASALLLHERLRGAEPRDRLTHAAALGIALALTTLIRAQGVLLIALLLPLLRWRDGRWRDAGVCAALALLPVVAWRVIQLRMIAGGPLAMQPDESYTTFIGASGLAEVVRVAGASLPGNAIDYTRVMSASLTGIPVLGTCLFISAVLLAVGGGARIGRTHGALVLTVLVNGLAVLAWPFTQDRLLLPVLPFAGLLAAAALQPFAERGGERVKRWLWAPLVAVLVIVGIRQPLIRHEASKAPPGDRVPSSSPSVLLSGLNRYTYVVSRWVLSHTRMSDRILVSMPSAIFLYTGRKAVPSQPSENRLARSLFREPGRYFATRILEDSVTIVLLEDPRSQSVSEIAAIQKRCPGALRYLGSAAPNVAPLFFAATPGDECLQREFGN
jgi:hypothetical protein